MWSHGLLPSLHILYGFGQVPRYRYDTAVRATSLHISHGGALGPLHNFLVLPPSLPSTQSTTMADANQAMMEDDKAAAAFVEELQKIKLDEGDTIESLERKLIDLFDQRKQLQERLRQIMEKKTGTGTGTAGAKTQEEHEEFEKVLLTASQIIFKLEKECGRVRDLFVKPSTPTPTPTPTPSEMHA